MELRTLDYGHPDCQQLIAEVQQEYVVRYGGPDETPMAPAHFTPPDGIFLVGYLAGTPVACGGWRSRDADDSGLRDGDAEIKRMYVTPPSRGRGLARLVLAELERSAAVAGRYRMVLETGVKQPEAIALYRSCGYIETDRFGVYRNAESSRYFAKPLR